MDTNSNSANANQKGGAGFDWVELKNLVPKPKSSPPQTSLLNNQLAPVHHHQSDGGGGVMMSATTSNDHLHNHHSASPPPAATTTMPPTKIPHKTKATGKKKAHAHDKSSAAAASQKRVVSDAPVKPLQIMSPLHQNASGHHSGGETGGMQFPKVGKSSNSHVHELNHHHGSKLHDAIMVRRSHDGTTSMTQQQLSNSEPDAHKAVREAVEELGLGGGGGGIKKKPRPLSGGHQPTSGPTTSSASAHQPPTAHKHPSSKKAAALEAAAAAAAANNIMVGKHHPSTNNTTTTGGKHNQPAKQVSVPRSQFLLREANQKKISESEVQSARVHQERKGGMKWDFKQPNPNQHQGGGGGAGDSAAIAGISVQGVGSGGSNTIAGQQQLPQQHAASSGAKPPRGEQQQSHVSHSHQPSPAPPLLQIGSGSNSRIPSRSQSPGIGSGSSSARTLGSKLPVPPPPDINSTVAPNNSNIGGGNAGKTVRRQSLVHRGLPSAVNHHQSNTNSGGAVGADPQQQHLQVRGQSQTSTAHQQPPNHYQPQQRHQTPAMKDEESESLLEELERNVAEERHAREEVRRAHRRTVATFRKLVAQFKNTEEQRHVAGLPPASPNVGQGTSIQSAKCSVVVHMLACHIQAFARARQSKTFVKALNEGGGVPSALAMRASLAKSKPMALDTTALAQSSTPFVISALHQNTEHPPMSNTKSVTSARGEGGIAAQLSGSFSDVGGGAALLDNGSFQQQQLSAPDGSPNCDDGSFATHLDSSTISHLKQLYFDYYDCETFALDGNQQQQQQRKKKYHHKGPAGSAAGHHHQQQEIDDDPSSSLHEQPIQPPQVASSTEYLADVDQQQQSVTKQLPPRAPNSNNNGGGTGYEAVPLGRRLIASAGSASNPRLSAQVGYGPAAGGSLSRGKADLTPVTAFAMRTAYAEINDFDGSDTEDDISPRAALGRDVAGGISAADDFTKGSFRHHDHPVGPGGSSGLPPMDLYNVIEEENVLIPDATPIQDEEDGGGGAEAMTATTEVAESPSAGDALNVMVDHQQHPSADDLVVVGSNKPSGELATKFEIVQPLQIPPHGSSSTSTFLVEEEEGCIEAADFSARRGQLDDIMEDLAADAQLSSSPQGAPMSVINEVIEANGGAGGGSGGANNAANNYRPPLSLDVISNSTVGGGSCDTSMSPGLVFNIEKEKQAIHGSGMSCSSPDEEM